MRRKKKKVETRKRKAIRRTAMLFIAAMGVSALHICVLFPMQAVNYEAEEFNTGSTHLIQRMSGDKWNQMVYMTANDNAILITEVSFYPLLGWSGGLVAVLDCADEGDFQARPITRRDGDDKAAHWAICGRLRSPEVVGIRAECQCQYWDENAEINCTLPEVTISGGPEIWTEKGSWRYFFLETTIPDAENGEIPFPIEITVTTLDKAGNPMRQYGQGNDLYNRFVPVDE